MVNQPWSKSDVGTYSQHDNSELNIIYPIILNMLGEVKDKKIADYGCGEGQLIQILIKKEAEVFGYDISDSMISKSRKRVGSKAKLARIESGEIPLSNNTLDSVVSNFVLMMCNSTDSLRKIQKEIYRVLKPEGIWIYCITHPAFTDKRFTTFRNIFNGNRDYFQTAQQYQFVLQRKNGEEITDESFIDYHYSLSTYLNLLPESGFVFKKLHEVYVPDNKLPPYLIVKSMKGSY